MSKVFISYKRQDKETVFSIVEEIKNKTGADCWIDKEGIESGDQFQNVIIDAIDKADIFIFMLSRNFIAPYIDEKSGQIDMRRRTFTEKEVMYALSEGKQMVPISIDGTTVNDCKWLKFNFSGNNYIDYIDPVQKEKLFDDLKVWCSKEPIKVLSVNVKDENIKQVLEVLNSVNSTIIDIKHSDNDITLIVNMQNDVVDDAIILLHSISDSINVMKVPTWIDVLVSFFVLSPLVTTIAGLGLALYFGKSVLKQYLDLDDSAIDKKPKELPGETDNDSNA